MNNKIIALLLLSFQIVQLYASKQINRDDLKRRGNLALSTSQMPGPLFSFGQYIVDKHDKQFFVGLDQIKGKNRNYIALTPSFLYGISDSLSIFFNAPVTAYQSHRDDASSGFQDIFVQMEYAYYNHEGSTAYRQATVVAAVYGPSGSTQLVPSTGSGLMSFFVGGTTSYTSADWYVYTSAGLFVSAPEKGTKDGSQWLYQAGISRNIDTFPGWIVTPGVEFNGTYEAKGTLCHQRNHDSGGNTMYVCPVLWVSNARLIIQIGAGVPVYQKLYGVQEKASYTFAVSVGWKL